MLLDPVVLPDADAVGTAVARLIVDRLHAADPGRPFLWGCPGGRTPTPTYRALARIASQEALDLSDVTIVMMDEYLVPDQEGELHRVDPRRSFSCAGFAHREILKPLREACAISGGRGPERLWLPDPRDPARYDARIRDAGGIDLFLLASGASDGHIAFNQPGVARTSRTHITTLGEATRRDNMGTFPEFTHLDLVPTHGVTVGIDTIATHTREAIMIVCGAHKRDAFARLSTATSYDAEWPATIATECHNTTLMADQAAAQ